MTPDDVYLNDNFFCSGTYDIISEDWTSALREWKSVDTEAGRQGRLTAAFFLDIEVPFDLVLTHHASVPNCVRASSLRGRHKRRAD